MPKSGTGSGRGGYDEQLRSIPKIGKSRGTQKQENYRRPSGKEMRHKKVPPLKGETFFVGEGTRL